MGRREFLYKEGGQGKDRWDLYFGRILPEDIKRGHRRYMRNEVYFRYSGIPYLLVGFSKTTYYPTGSITKNKVFK